MSYTRKNSDEFQHKRILEITRLLEDGKAGINKQGRIVDLRKYPRASRISMSTLRAARVLMTPKEMHIIR